MKKIHFNKTNVRRLRVGLLLLLMLVTLCACTAEETELIGIWKGKASDFAARDEALQGNDMVYYLYIKGNAAFDLFEVTDNGGKVKRESLLMQPGSYRLTGGWLTLNEVAATRPYREGDVLTLKNGDETVELHRAYEVLYEFTGEVPKNKRNKVPQDNRVYDLGDPFTVEDTFKAGDTVDLKDSEGNVEHYTFLGWDREDGVIDGDIRITGEWKMEKLPAETN